MFVGLASKIGEMADFDGLVARMLVVRHAPVGNRKPWSPPGSSSRP